MNNTTKALIACLAILGVWIAVQQMQRPAPRPAIQPRAESGG